MPITFINTTEEHFINEENIFRVLNIDRVLQIFQENKLSFLSPSKWKDPWEKEFLFANFSYRNRIVQLPYKPTGDPHLFKMFCQCWSKIQESEAFWGVYTPNSFGVKLTMTTEKMLEFLNTLEDQVFIGKVYYLPSFRLRLATEESKEEFLERNPRPLRNLEKLNIDLMLRKRLPYRYEEEYRIFIIKEDGIIDEFIDYQFEPRRFIERVVFHPELEERYYMHFKSFLTPFFFKNKIAKSSFRKRPGPINIVL